MQRISSAGLSLGTSKQIRLNIKSDVAVRVMCDSCETIQAEWRSMATALPLNPRHRMRRRVKTVCVFERRAVVLRILDWECVRMGNVRLNGFPTRCGGRFRSRLVRNSLAWYHKGGSIAKVNEARSPKNDERESHYLRTQNRDTGHCQLMRCMK